MHCSTNLRAAAAVTFALSMAACKTDSAGPREIISRIDAVSPVDLTGEVGTAATPTPLVRVTDSDGNPSPNVDVAFAVIAGNGSIGPTHVLTDTDGRATVTWYLGTTVTKQTLTATAGSLPPIVFNATTVAGPPTIFERTSGDIQAAAVGTVPAIALQARITDSYRNPIKGLTVSFAVASGGGTIDPADRVTDSAGYVTAGAWTLGPAEGAQTLRAQAGTLAQIFSADAYDCSAATTEAPCAGLGELLFIRNSDSQIYRVRVDGKALTKLTNTGSNYGAVWSPDGRRIAFIRYTPAPNNSGPGTHDLFTMNADGSNQTRRLSLGGYGSVAWSPDGQKLAAAWYDYNSDYSSIYSMNAVDDGEPPALLVVDGASPVWSPDGKRIAYIHGTGYYDNAVIYLMNADGTNAHLISEILGWHSNPEWSPDGNKIAFVGCYQGCAVYIMGADGSTPVAMTPTLTAQDVAWSPNGKWLSLAYWSNSTESIWYMPSDVQGGALRPVLNDGWHAKWRPTPR